MKQKKLVMQINVLQYMQDYLLIKSENQLHNQHQEQIAKLQLMLNIYYNLQHPKINVYQKEEAAQATIQLDHSLSMIKKHNICNNRGSTPSTYKVYRADTCISFSFIGKLQTNALYKNEPGINSLLQVRRKLINSEQLFNAQSKRNHTSVGSHEKIQKDDQINYCALRAAIGNMIEIIHCNPKLKK
ncbi:unnamed protein product [Paramecium octaurelia]|uniref:Uncharacterized protein n=1 Tax=Paramecium octaurelia TaxID=43137 RepID=A0A8S1YMV5_PAROT|nr:unnamed protein product [Paramecium octaurelia]